MQGTVQLLYRTSHGLYGVTAIPIQTIAKGRTLKRKPREFAGTNARFWRYIERLGRIGFSTELNRKWLS